MTCSVPGLKADVDVTFLLTVLAIYRLGIKETSQQRLAILFQMTDSAIGSKITKNA